MIYESSLQHLNEAIKIYNRFVGKTYLIAYCVNKNHPFCFTEFIFRQKHFWHLLGCEFDGEKNYTPEQKGYFYNSCLNGEDVKEALNYTQSNKETDSKYAVFMKIFDIISNAKEILITETDNSPEEAVFKIGAGKMIGTIGYAKDDNSSTYFPKTVQDKSIFKINPKANKKIVFILSKPAGEQHYTEIEYEIKKEIVRDSLEELPEEILKKISVERCGLILDSSQCQEKSKEET